MSAQASLFEQDRRGAERPRAVEAAPGVPIAPRPSTGNPASGVASTAREHDPDQAEQLARVSGRLAEAILCFCRHRLASRVPEFTADELHAAAPQSAPGSADRVLRDLRRRGQLAYVVTNRASSLYRLSFVANP